MRRPKRRSSEHTVKLTPNGDGTGRLEIICPRVAVVQRKPGLYIVADIEELMPLKLQCKSEQLQPRLIVKLYCRTRKKNLGRLGWINDRIESRKSMLANAA